MQFSPQFNSKYKGGPLRLEFCIGRSTFVRQHHAIRTAKACLTKEVLFPQDVVSKSPKIPFYEDENQTSADNSGSEDLQPEDFNDFLDDAAEDLLVRIVRHQHSYFRCNSP